MSQEIEQCQCIYQKINGLFDVLLAKREHIEGKVETLYMKLYCRIHATIDGNNDDVSQEKYQGSNEAYTQTGHQKCNLERRLAEIDGEIERLDVEKDEISERKEILLEEQLDLGLRKKSIDERKRSVESEMLNK